MINDIQENFHLSGLLLYTYAYKQVRSSKSSRRARGENTDTRQKIHVYRNILSSQISYSPNRSAITRKSSVRSKKFTNINYLNGQNMTLVFMIKIDIVRQNFERSWKNTFFVSPANQEIRLSRAVAQENA